MSRKKPNPNHPLTGTKQSIDHIRSRIEARRENGNYVGRKGPENNFYGKPAWNKGRRGLQHHSIETRKLQSDKKKGYIPWNKGKTGIYSEETLLKKAKSMTGQKRTEETKEKMRKSQQDRHKRRIASGQEWHRTGIHHYEKTKELMRKARAKQIFPKHDTGIEKMMQKALTDQGINWEKQKLFENDQYYHRVDLFIKPNVCVECDGDFWHRSKPDVVNRDRMTNDILPEMGQIVVRVRGSDIRRDPNKCAMAIQQIMVRENGAHKKGV